MLVFAAIFLFGSSPRLHSASWQLSAASAAAGASCAYVFVELLPELSEAGEEFVVATAHRRLLFPEFRYLPFALGAAFYAGPVLALRRTVAA